MKFEQVIVELQELKGGQAWRDIAERAEVRYDTLARIARRAIPSPSVLIVERIADAIEAFKWARDHELSDDSKSAIQEWAETASDAATLDDMPREFVPGLRRRAAA